MRDTYRISTWDCERDKWRTAYRRISKWGIRKKLRLLYRGGWTQMSVQVKAETHDRPAARWDRGFIASVSHSPRLREILKGDYCA